MSNQFGRMDAINVQLAALALLIPGMLLAAAPAARPDDKNDILNEVTITAEKPTRKVADLIPFLRRILGQYTVDGKVDLGGQGKPEERWTAVGTGNCVGFGVAPGVQCELNVKWPQIPGPNGEAVMSGIFGMEPMMILYGLEPDELGIRYLQVNNRGLAEGATGYMINDTVTFKTPCVNTDTHCERITRVTARSEDKVVDFQIDTEIDSKVAARFNFKLRRVGNPQADLVTTTKAVIDTRPAPPEQGTRGAEMNRVRLIAMAVLAGTVVLASRIANSQPRSEPEINLAAILPVTEPAQVSEWLQRLTGRFRYDGMIQMGDCVQVPSAGGGPPPPPSDKCQGARGKSDCVAVGSGPGVQCILNVTWQDIYDVDFENGQVREIMISYLDPAMELYGLEPANLAMHRLIVNNKGIAEGGPGYIKGNTATFRAPCANAESVGCYRIVRVEAKPDAKLLYVWLSFRMEPEPENTYAVMTLRRVAVEEESAPTLKPVSQRRK